MAIPAASWPSAQQSADRALQRFMADHPEVAFAEYGHFGRTNRARVIAVIDGDEWEGYGVTLNWALTDARCNAKGIGPDRSERGFAYRVRPADFAKINAGHRAFARGGAK